MERSKLTVTIRNDLFSQIDSMVDGEKIRNRSHAAEYLILRGLGLNRIRQAFIVAGGQGTRLRPLTYELPTALIPIHGKPLLAHVLQRLAQYDVRNIIISVGHKKEKVMAAFGDGKAFNVRITYVTEDKPLGTAGPLRLAQKQLSTEPFFLIWGDVLAAIDLLDFAQFHKDNGGITTLAVTSVSDPSRMGAVDMQGSKIISFVEKPQPGHETTKIVSAGYAVCNPEILDYIPKKRHVMMETEVYPILAKEEKLVGYHFSGQWFDMDTAENYERALQEWNDLPA